MRLLKTLPAGAQPVALAYSALSQAVYVVDGQEGRVRVFDARRHQLRHTLQAEPGLGALQFSRDGRYGVLLDTLDNQALVIDAGGDQLIHRIAVAPEPYQVAFTKGYAYVRGLASPQVSVIELASLGQGLTPGVHVFEAGPSAPQQAGDLPLAEAVSASRDDNAVFVVNPVDNTTYFYAEGLRAPTSGYTNPGHQARAALVIDRSLREVAPGVYGSTVRLPAAGTFDVAFSLDQPQIVHCFSTEVAALSSLPLTKVGEGAYPLAGQHFTRLQVLSAAAAPTASQGEPRSLR
jgi:DNA-binding beta-propeller fold protein YncE